MKTAIITGSSSGFGELIALELAKEDFHVIATMRDIKKADRLLKLAMEQKVQDKIKIYPLDITNSESINEFRRFVSHLSSIDLLVNNAGFAQGGFCEELSIDDYCSQFETNFFGTVSVTKAVLPILRKQGSGLIVNISSISGIFGFPGLSAYAASKHALEGFSESLRLELKPFGIDVALIEPGSYNTNIWSSIGNIHSNDHSPYRSAKKAIMERILANKEQFGNPLEVAKLVSKIARHKGNLPLRFPVGKGVRSSLLLKWLLPWKTVERALMKQLYK